jgi:PEP-CTERM motif
MARKITFTLATLLFLATMLTGASFANVVPTQITFGPNTTGSISVTSTYATFSSVSGFAYQSTQAGSFSLGNNTVFFANGNSPYTLLPNSTWFTVDIGADSLAGWVNLDTMYLNGPFGFFTGKYSITSSTPGFVQTGFSAGSSVDVDFVTYKGRLSSGELIPAVPEPGTIALVGSGLLAAAGMLRRKF